MDFKAINKEHFDILKEIGNIGAGNAVTALAKMTSAKVDMNVPRVMLLGFSEVSELLGHPEDLVFGILVSFEGDLNGMMMMVFKRESARALINALMGREIADTEEFDEMDFSALVEVGNILSSSYLGALGELIGKKVMPSVPSLAKDMAGAILSVPAVAFGIYADEVLFIESVFDGGTQTGYFILVPDIESFHIIVESLGII